MRTRLGLVVLAVVAMALVAAGCGGDDDDDAPTKEEFITQADDICTEGDQVIEEQAAEVFGSGQPSKAQQEAFIEDTVIPETQSQIDGIRELTPPEGDEDEVNAIVDAADQGIDEIESDPAALTQGGANPLAEASQLAAEYGMKDCGQG
jgi:hypothetical protein